MTEIDLKAYTTRLVELESAVYSQRKLMKLHEDIIKKQCPQAPPVLTAVSPEEPKRRKERNKQEETQGSKNAIGCATLPFVFMLLTIFSGALNYGMDGSTGFVLILCIIGCPMFIIYKWIRIKELEENIDKYNAESETMYEKQKEEYPTLLKTYEESLATAEKYNKEKTNAYEKALEEYTERYNETMHNHNMALESLEKALQEAYAENVIFPKYRNFVAISAINEYLLSGRCDKLDGANGAYNLYEMELRQNVVISQLSSIVDNLEGIRENQFMLYEELQRSNFILDEILEEARIMKEYTKLNTYFAEVSAKAAVAPRYYSGVIM